jgi:sRNA-binding carbon storage regulator CsrA
MKIIGRKKKESITIGSLTKKEELDKDTTIQVKVVDIIGGKARIGFYTGENMIEILETEKFEKKVGDPRQYKDKLVGMDSACYVLAKDDIIFIGMEGQKDAIGKNQLIQVIVTKEPDDGVNIEINRPRNIPVLTKGEHDIKKRT